MEIDLLFVVIVCFSIQSAILGVRNFISFPNHTLQVEFGLDSTMQQDVLEKCGKTYFVWFFNLCLRLLLAGTFIPLHNCRLWNTVFLRCNNNNNNVLFTSFLHSS